MLDLDWRNCSTIPVDRNWKRIISNHYSFVDTDILFCNTLLRVSSYRICANDYYCGMTTPISDLSENCVFCLKWNKTHQQHIKMSYMRIRTVIKSFIKEKSGFRHNGVIPPDNSTMNVFCYKRIYEKPLP